MVAEDLAVIHRAHAAARRVLQHDPAPVVGEQLVAGDELMGVDPPASPRPEGVLGGGGDGAAAEGQAQKREECRTVVLNNLFSGIAIYL
jgi:hypothetical protein